MFLYVFRSLLFLSSISINPVGEFKMRIILKLRKFNILKLYSNYWRKRWDFWKIHVGYIFSFPVGILDGSVVPISYENNS